MPLAAGAALLAGFVTWERRCRYPLVDLGLFRSSRFAWSTSFVTLIGFSMFGLMFFGALANAGYRHGLGLSSLPAGLAGAVRGSVAGGVVVAEKLHDPQLQKQVCTAFVHAMDTTLLVTGGVAALAAVLALWFPRLAAIRQGPAAPASVEIPVPAGRR